MARITFAHPLFLAQSPREQAAASPYFPLGLLYLAAYVRERGHEVSIFDGTFAADETSFANHLADHQPDVVGISALVTTRAAALGLARLAQATGAIAVVGGPDPTASPHAYLAESAVELVVHHEGEQTIARLLDIADDGGLDRAAYSDELGIAYRHNGAVVVRPPRTPIENLDDLPLPARDLIDVDRYLRMWKSDHGYTSVTVSTSRGCPYGCVWCRDGVHGDGFRQRSPENVAMELRAIKDSYDVSSIRLVDDVDGIERAWLQDWASAAHDVDAAIPFEPLNRIARQDIPLLEVRDSL